MAVDMFMKIGDIAGESTDKKHPGEIDVLAWSWGISNSGTTHQGGGGGAGKANVQDLSFTKYIDVSSHALLLAASNGQHYPKANLVVRKAGGKGAPIEYIKIEMEEVLITTRELRRFGRRRPSDRERDAELRQGEVRVHAAEAGRLARLHEGNDLQHRRERQLLSVALSSRDAAPGRRATRPFLPGCALS